MIVLVQKFHIKLTLLLYLPPKHSRNTSKQNFTWLIINILSANLFLSYTLENISIMLPQNTIIKLRNDFTRKIREEWSAKWEVKFGELDTDYPFPTSNEFLLALIAALTESVPEKGLSAKQLEAFVPSSDTLKRNLKAKNNDGMRENTRECLAFYLGYKGGFNDFVQKQSVGANIDDKPIIIKKDKKWMIGVGIIGGIAFGLLLLWVYQKATPSERIIKPRIIKVNLGSEKAPITAKIDYDLGNMPVDSAYLDFEWKDRVGIGIDKKEKSVFYCFLHPTRRLAKLMVNGRCVDSTQIVIPSDGWMMGYESIYYIDKNNWQKAGIAHVAAEDIAEEFKKKGVYTSFIKKVGGFNGVSCDEFSFETRLKNPKPVGTTLCSDATLILVGSQNKLLLNLTQIGCSFFSYVKFNADLLGQKQDFQNLSANLNEFIKVNIKTNNHKINIFIDEKLSFTANYNKKLGDLEAIDINFQNSGSVDYVKGESSKTRKLLFYDNFEKR